GRSRVRHPRRQRRAGRRQPAGPPGAGRLPRRHLPARRRVRGTAMPPPRRRTDLSTLRAEATSLGRERRRAWETVAGTQDTGARRAAARRAIEIDTRISEVIESMGLLADPLDAPPDVPLVLLPVRLETRFTGSGRST